jgi:hypothetical protein
MKMKKLKNKLSFVILGIFLFLYAISIISADTGPHSSATLYFKVSYYNNSIAENFNYSNSIVGEIFNASLLACRETGCKVDNYALCTNAVCEFNYYRIERVPSQMKLLVNIHGENFTSYIINFSWTKPALYYDVNINPDKSMMVSPSLKEENTSTSLWVSFILALALTIIIEIIVLIIFLKKWKIKDKKWKNPIITLIIANIITVPLVWILFFSLVTIFTNILSIAGIFFALLIVEVFAFVFEAYFIYWLNKKIINLRNSFILSLAMNLASFIVGGITLTIILSLI